MQRQQHIRLIRYNLPSLPPVYKIGEYPITTHSDKPVVSGGKLPKIRHKGELK